MSKLSRFGLSESSPGTHSLFFSDFSPTTDIFEDHGHEGAGYDWASVARQVIHERAPELRGVIKFSPEAAMFAASSPDRAALEKLAGLLSELAGNRRELAAIISRIPPSEWD